MTPFLLFGLLAGVGVAAVPAHEDAARASEACGGCHGAALAAWSGSAHAVSATNTLFRAGFKVEPRQFCVGCHAPVAAGADDGIGCLTCHAAGATHASAAVRPATPGGHVVALRTRDELRDPAFCKGCHEFATPAFDGGEMRLTDLPMQSTYSEWLAYARDGGSETCQSCHMPAGRHAMSGAHDVALLRRSLTVSVSDGALTLTSVGVGHAFPTGDLFRHLTVEVRDEDGDDQGWRVVERIGRTFDTRLEEVTLLAHKVETAYTSLLPGVPRVVSLPGATRAWRVRYHYGSERDERRGLVPDAALFATLAEGQIAAARTSSPPPPPAASPATDPALASGFVDLADVAPGVRIDIRYAGARNFVGRPVRGYDAARCLVTRRAAAALSRVEHALEPRGYRLAVFDCYRPKRAVDDFVAWARTPPAAARTPEHNPLVPKGELFRRGYIAARSAHSRGSTVDLSLISIASEIAGAAARTPTPGPDCRTVAGALAPDGTLNMGTTFDCFDERAHADADVPPEARRNRQLLREAMEKAGFVIYDKEWWHFSLANEPFPDTAFDFEIAPRARM